MNAKKEAAELQEWTVVKRQDGLTDAHVQMARELGMKPRQLLQTRDPGPDASARRIEQLYVKSFKRPLPESVVPVRQLLHDAGPVRELKLANGGAGNARPRKTISKPCVYQCWHCAICMEAWEQMTTFSG